QGRSVRLRRRLGRSFHTTGSAENRSCWAFYRSPWRPSIYRVLPVIACINWWERAFSVVHVQTDLFPDRTYPAGATFPAGPGFYRVTLPGFCAPDILHSIHVS